MGVLGERELYIRGIYVKDDLPRDNYVYGLPVVQLGLGGIEHVDYRETDHFQIMARFLGDPERMLSYLFG